MRMRYFTLLSLITFENLLSSLKKTDSDCSNNSNPNRVVINYRISFDTKERKPQPFFLPTRAYPVPVDSELFARLTEDTNLGTSTALLPATVFEVAKSSNRFHVLSRFAFNSVLFSSSTWNLAKHSSKRAWSMSQNTFLTFIVRL